mgnify:CR=1 FL=1
MAQRTKMLEPKPGKEKLLIKLGTKPGNIGDALTDMHGGESRSGFLSGGNIIRKTDYVPLPDSIDGIRQKRAIQKVLVGIIEPNPLSMKSTLEMDRRSLVTKLNRLTLSDIKKLVPERLKGMTPEEIAIVEVTDEEKSEIQDLYKEVSP